MPVAYWGIAEYRLKNKHQAFQQLWRALQFGVERREFLAIGSALPGIALVLADDAKTEQAVELFALMWRYPLIANSVNWADIAGRELTAVADSLPPEVAKAAMERGREMDLWQTAESLLAELTELGWGDGT